MIKYLLSLYFLLPPLTAWSAPVCAELFNQQTQVKVIKESRETIDPRNHSEIFKLLEVNNDDFLKDGLSARTTVEGKIKKRSHGWVFETDESYNSQTMPIDDPTQIQITDRVEPIHRINSNGHEVVVLYRTLISSDFSPHFENEILTRGLDSRGLFDTGSGKALREGNKRHRANGEYMDVGRMTEITKRGSTNYELYMPFTSNPSVAATYDGMRSNFDDCKTIIIEIEVPIEKIKAISELSTDNWQNDRYKFVFKDTDDAYSVESEYTFTGHHLNQKYINKVYSISADGEVNIFSVQKK